MRESRHAAMGKVTASPIPNETVAATYGAATDNNREDRI